MHFGAAIRDVLSASCGSDLSDAGARTAVPALRSPETQRLLAAQVEAAFGVSIPPTDLAHLSTVRDVLQCVRLRRWVARVERSAAERAPTSAERATDAAASAPADPTEAVFRVTRRPAGAMTSPMTGAPETPLTAKRH